MSEGLENLKNKRPRAQSRAERAALLDESREMIRKSPTGGVVDASKKPVDVDRDQREYLARLEKLAQEARKKITRPSNEQ